MVSVLTSVVRITENGEFYQSYPGFNDYFGGQHGEHPMPFLPPTSGQEGAQLVDASGHPAGETAMSLGGATRMRVLEQS